MLGGLHQQGCRWSKLYKWTDLIIVPLGPGSPLTNRTGFRLFVERLHCNRIIARMDTVSTILIR